MSQGIADRLRESRLQVEARRIQIAETRVYGGDKLPPGAVPAPAGPVEGHTINEANAKRGVPPIGTISSRLGEVMPDEGFDDFTSARLPFRFPWYSRAYGLWIDDDLCGVFRNVNPFDLAVGHDVAVQLNETHDWSAFFGRVKALRCDQVTVERPDGTQRKVKFAEIHFVGKVMGYWRMTDKDG